MGHSKCLLAFSYGISDSGGDAGDASHLEQLQGSSQRQDQADAVEGHVRHSCQVEEVRRSARSVSQGPTGPSPMGLGFGLVRLGADGAPVSASCAQDRRSRPAGPVVGSDACSKPQPRVQQSHQSHQVTTTSPTLTAHLCGFIKDLLDSLEDKPQVETALHFLSSRGQIINIRYLAYFDSILDFIKDRILVYHG